jgi:hypothetical protein
MTLKLGARTACPHDRLALAAGNLRVAVATM